MEPTTVTGLDVAAVRGEFPVLESGVAYLDSAASAQKPRVVLDVLQDTFAHHYANIHRGVYSLSQEATELFEGARRTVASWIGAEFEEVVFTKNVTEAINLVAYSWGRSQIGPGDRVLITAMEHHSNIVPWQLLVKEKGASLGYVDVRDDGSLDLDSLDRELARGDVRFVGVVHVSNVLGTINPVAEIVRRAHSAGAVVLVDGAQAAPHYPIDVKEIGADFYGFTGHKVYGPTGVGVLHGRRELLESMPPFLSGGDMIGRVDWQETTWNSLPWKFEAGTTSFVDAIGLAAALRWLGSLGMDSVRAHESSLTSYALERLAEVPGLSLYGPPLGEPRGTLASFALEGVHPHDVAEILSRDGVCIRAGHHCAQPLMRRLGVPATSRASLAVHNTREDVDRLIDGLGNVRRVFEL